MLNGILKLFQALNSNKKPAEIAHACCLGVILGFMPKNNALWYIIFVFFFFVRINKGAYLVMTAIISLFAWRLDPVFNYVGYQILTLPQFENFFSWLLDIPFVGFTKFNNTIVMGSLVVSLVAYIPVFILTKLFVLLWRKKISPKLGSLGFVKFLTKIPLVKKAIDFTSEKM